MQITKYAIVREAGKKIYQWKNLLIRMKNA